MIKSFDVQDLEYFAEEHNEIETQDEATQTSTASQPRTGNRVTFTVHVVYSVTYQSPVLYFNAYDDRACEFVESVTTLC
jgi:hypothetical protein